MVPTIHSMESCILSSMCQFHMHSSNYIQNLIFTYNLSIQGILWRLCLAKKNTCIVDTVCFGHAYCVGYVPYSMKHEALD